MVFLRGIRESDLEMVMHWRMLPEITQYMYTDPLLTMEKQRAWFADISTDEKNMVFVIVVDDVPVGIMNINDIDSINKRCSWGYYVAVREKRSLELAMALEWNLYDYVFDVLGMHKLVGEIISSNKGVVRIHQMCGSEVEGVLKEHVCKNGQYYDVTVTGILRDRWREIKEKYSYEEISFEQV